MSSSSAAPFGAYGNYTSLVFGLCADDIDDCFYPPRTRPTRLRTTSTEGWKFRRLPEFSSIFHRPGQHGDVVSVNRRREVREASIRVINFG